MIAWDGISGWPLAAGALAYLAAGLAEWGGLRGLRAARPLGWGLCVLLHAWAVPAAAMAGPDLPGGGTVLGWAVVVPSALLLAWSLVAEIPIATSYGSAPGASSLVTTGTYALCRHPGVLWYLALLVGLLLVTGSGTLLVAIPLWIGLDVAYVAWEEAVVLRRLFPEYPAYQRSTPFLVPTPGSLALALRTFPLRRSPS